MGGRWKNAGSAGRFLRPAYKQVGSLSRWLLGLNSGRSVSINVNKTRKHFSRNIHSMRMFSQCFQVYHTGNIVSTVSFSKMEIKIRVCEQLQKFCEHEQASTDRVIVASNSSKRQILRALLHWMGPFDTAHGVQMFSQISRIPDLIQKFWAKRCGLYTDVCGTQFHCMVWRQNIEAKSGSLQSMVK